MALDVMPSPKKHRQLAFGACTLRLRYRFLVRLRWHVRWHRGAIIVWNGPVNDARYWAMSRRAIGLKASRWPMHCNCWRVYTSHSERDSADVFDGHADGSGGLGMGDLLAARQAGRRSGASHSWQLHSSFAHGTSVACGMVAKSEMGACWRLVCHIVGRVYISAWLCRLVCGNHTTQSDHSRIGPVVSACPNRDWRCTSFG